jgi:membrane protein implicated in regulation of membrane protease activity
MTARAPLSPLKSLVWPMRLTLVGLWAERLSRAFWPLWSLILTTIAALTFGLQDVGPLVWVQVAGAVIAVVAIGLLVLGLRRFRRPTESDALARLDAAMPGRPIAALQDTQAIGWPGVQHWPSRSPLICACRRVIRSACVMWR